MNKKIISQINMYFNGLLSRLDEIENRENFIKIDIAFKSGLKTYTAGINIPEDYAETGLLEMEYNGGKHKSEKPGITEIIEMESAKYEAMELKYIALDKVTCLVADEKSVKMTTETLKTKVETLKQAAENSHIGNREYIIKPGQGDELLKAIGIMAQNGKIKNDMIRKYNQIDHFIELLQENIKEICNGNKKVTVMDCACGKSYLSFVLNYYIKFVLGKPCEFIGIDYSDSVIEASRKTAAELGYSNMEFIKADLNDYDPKRKIDLCISLHACDTATDMAIVCAVRNKASMIVVVPCCHKELLEQIQIDKMESILKYGILKARISDAITDGLRASFLEAIGHQVSVVEYISPLETPKNLMIKAIKKSGINHNKLVEYWKLCNELSISPTLAKLVNLE